MSNKALTHIHEKPSKLDQFSLGFELNETWADARKKYTAISTKK